MRPQKDDIGDRFPYECQTRHPYTDVVPWCESQFGPFDDRWYRYGTDIASGVTGWSQIDSRSQDYYRFAREQDAVLFRLRWSG